MLEPMEPNRAASDNLWMARMRVDPETCDMMYRILYTNYRDLSQ